MNDHLYLFLRIFCVMGLIGFGIGTVLSVSSTPISPAMVIIFGGVTVIMAVGTFLTRRRAEP